MRSRLDRRAGAPRANCSEDGQQGRHVRDSEGQIGLVGLSAENWDHPGPRVLIELQWGVFCAMSLGGRARQEEGGGGNRRRGRRREGKGGGGRRGKEEVGGREGGGGR